MHEDIYYNITYVNEEMEMTENSEIRAEVKSIMVCL